MFNWIKNLFSSRDADVTSVADAEPDADVPVLVFEAVQTFEDELDGVRSRYVTGHRYTASADNRGLRRKAHAWASRGLVRFVNDEPGPATAPRATIRGRGRVRNRR